MWAQGNNFHYKSHMEVGPGKAPKQAGALISSCDSLMQRLDTKFRAHRFPSGPLITSKMYNDHRNYVKREQLPLYTFHPSTTDWQVVFVPRAGMFRAIATALGRETQFDLNNEADIATILQHIPGLVEKYEKGHTALPGETFDAYVERRTLFHKVEKVQPESFWEGLTCSGVKAKYYHGAAGALTQKEMGDLCVKCTCEEYLLRMMCPHAGSLGLNWKPAPLLQKFDERRVGMAYAPHCPQKSTPALTRMTPVFDQQNGTVATAPHGTAATAPKVCADSHHSSDRLANRSFTENRSFLQEAPALKRKDPPPPVSPPAPRVHGRDTELGVGERETAGTSTPKQNAATKLKADERLGPQPPRDMWPYGGTHSLSGVVVVVCDEAGHTWRRGTITAGPQQRKRRGDNGATDDAARAFTIQFDPRDGVKTQPARENLPLELSQFGVSWFTVVPRAVCCECAFGGSCAIGEPLFPIHRPPFVVDQGPHKCGECSSALHNLCFQRYYRAQLASGELTDQAYVCPACKPL